jgi:hypothetical protein
MTRVSSTIGGVTSQTDIDDTTQSDGRSRLGHALSALGQSGRSLTVDVAGVSGSFTVDNHTLRELARDGHGTEHRLQTLVDALRDQHMPEAQRRSVAVRILGAVDQLQRSDITPAHGHDTTISMSIGERNTMTTSSDVVESGAHRPAPHGGPAPHGTAASQSVASRARPTHHERPLSPDTVWGLSDLGVHNRPVTIALNGHDVAAFDDAASAGRYPHTQTLELSGGMLMAFSLSADPVGDLQRHAREHGVRLSRDQARSALEQAAVTHDGLARVARDAHSDLDVSTYGFGASAATTMHVTTQDFHDLAAAAPGAARDAVLERIANREHVALGEGTDRMTSLMSLGTDIREAAMRRAGAQPRPQ